MQREFISPAIAPVLEKQPSAMDRFIICDMAGLTQALHAVPDGTRRNNDIGGTSWHGGMGYEQSLACVEGGDLSAVPQSEQYLDAMEQHVFVSRKYRVIDDVVGAFPNVPNMLAGVPCAMRRRIKTTTASAPLSVYVELAPSASVSAEQMRKRGAAILALVRLLSNKRPVELWTVTTLGATGCYHSIITQIDTAPLDLARAAHMLCHPSVPRVLGFSLLASKPWPAAAGWAYGSESLERTHGREALRRAIGPGADALYIPGAHTNDEALSDPIAWIRDKLADYGGETFEQE